MLAYVRHGRTIACHLIPAMKEAMLITSLATVGHPQPYWPEEDYAERVHFSRHRRSFSWPDNKGIATDITIYHLWHDCS